MAIQFPSVLANARQILIKKQQAVVPKRCAPVYVGDQATKKRYVVPLYHLSHPTFQGLLLQAEEEFGFNHPMGGLTIPCSEEKFYELTSELKC